MQVGILEALDPDPTLQIFFLFYIYLHIILKIIIPCQGHLVCSMYISQIQYWPKKLS